MKKLICSIIIGLCSINLLANPILTKQEINDILDTVKRHITDFTKCVNIIGNPSDNPEKEKLIEYNIPELFFRYSPENGPKKHSPRMIRHEFITGQYEQEPIKSYVSQVYDDASNGQRWVEISLNAENYYFSILQNPNSWKLIEEFDDCKLYAAELELDGQEYILRNLDPQKEFSNKFRYTEHSTYKIVIYYIEGIDNEPITLLGDIYQKLK